MRQIFLDTETTGLDPAAGDRIVEIGCIEMVARRLTGRHLHHYVHPDRTVPAEATRVHGLTDAFLADKPRFAAIGAELLTFVEGAEVIIHNASFDTGFLDAELARMGLAPLSRVVARVTDSLAMARRMHPGKANSLDALCRRFEVDNSRREFHGALLDASLLAEVYVRMTRGQDALAIEAEAKGSGRDAGAPKLDLRTYVLAEPEPSEGENLAHESWLLDLDKASSGKTVWRLAKAVA
jgi:DNA polymerase-3 subunit epsilon